MPNEESSAVGKPKHLIVWIIIFAVCVLAASVCLGFWVYHKILRSAMNELYDQARVDLSDVQAYVDKDIFANNSPGQASSGSSVEDSNEDELSPLAVINFPLLRETAPDVYAWIEIPGTDIAYPIVQHPKNNDYYLRRAISGAYDITGCIYTQNYNSLDFSDPNTLIYGHYMDDGTKFGSLLSYMDKEYFDSHRRIDVYTDGYWYTYEVFAALPFSTRHVLRSYKGSMESSERFLDDVYSSGDARAIVADDVDVDPVNDRIITLSTCLKTDTKRYVVLAKLVKSQLCE